MWKTKKRFMYKSEWPMLLALIVIAIIWLILFLHPIAVAIYMNNPIWLGLYILVIPEFIIAIIFSKIIIAIVKR